MPKLSVAIREQAVHMMLVEGSSVKDVVEHLKHSGVNVCRQTIWRLKQHYNQHKKCTPLPRSGRPKLLSPRKLTLIEETMQKDDESTGKELTVKLYQETGKKISLRTIYRGRRELGWTSRGAAYCQLIREVNKQKRLVWAQQYAGDPFHDVIWTDETSVQLETHRHFCCRKNGQKPRNKPRPKHPVKVHVWGGISWNGATRVCIFDGIMNAERYVSILDLTLVPFIRDKCPSGHRFMQDNDPKHTSRRAVAFFEEKGIRWWKTPPESPDANSIENLWHELKVINSFVPRPICL